MDRLKKKNIWLQVLDTGRRIDGVSSVCGEWFMGMESMDDDTIGQVSSFELHFISCFKP